MDYGTFKLLRIIVGSFKFSLQGKRMQYIQLHNSIMISLPMHYDSTCRIGIIPEGSIPKWLLIRGIGIIKPALFGLGHYIFLSRRSITIFILTLRGLLILFQEHNVRNMKYIRSPLRVNIKSDILHR